MVKCFSCGEWNNKNKYIFLSIIFLLINKFFFGFIFDEEIKYEIKILDNGIFSEHYLIHQIFLYFTCILLGCLLHIHQKIGQKNNISRSESDDRFTKNFSTIIKSTGSSVKDDNLISTEKSEKEKLKLHEIIGIFVLYIFLEQLKIVFKKFFVHMDFWMIELYIVAFINRKKFRIEIYGHQFLAFGINCLSFILNFIVVILTIIENDTEKALYVINNWFILAGLAIYFSYAFFLSYSFINIKKLMDLHFISLHVILLIYGITGFLFCLCFATIVTFINCENDVAKFIFKVKDFNNNHTYIDNIKIYFNSFTDINIKEGYKINEILLIVFSSISYAFYKLFTFKVIQDLTILHKIFSYPIYYFGQKFVFLCAGIYKVKEGWIISKFVLDLLSDILSIIGYLIYIEIIEINCCNFKYNLRKSIMSRGIIDSSITGRNMLVIEEEEVSDDTSNQISSNNTSSDMY